MARNTEAPTPKKRSRAKPPEQRKKRGPKPGKRHAGQWKPGQTGNPGGVPKSMHELRLLLRERGTSVLVLEQLEKAIKQTKSAMVLSTAAKLLWEFDFGKPTQAIELTGKDGKPMQMEQRHDLSKVPTDGLKQMEAILAAANAAGSQG